MLMAAEETHRVERKDGQSIGPKAVNCRQLRVIPRANFQLGVEPVITARC